MSFDRVPGQERAKGQIAAWFAGDRLPHAILLTGAEGSGKRRLAIELAKAMVCKVRPGHGCDECPSCRKVDTLQHPNVHTLLPLPTGTKASSDDDALTALRGAALEYLEGGSTARSGSNLPKSHILLLQREMSFAPTEAPRRVAIIFEADCMQPAGANSLLKILEEPPRHAVFLLVTASADRLLPTVVSRCQRLPLQALRGTQVRDQLVAQGTASERADLAGRLAEANGIRPDIVSGDDFDELRDRVERFIDSALTGKEQDYWQLLEEMGGRPDKQTMEGFLGLCSTYLRDLFLLGVQPTPAVTHPDRSERLAGWLQRLDARRIGAVAEGIDEAFDSQRHNVSSQLLLADLWHQLRRCGIVAA